MSTLNEEQKRQLQMQKNLLQELVSCDLEDVSYASATQLQDVTSRIEAVLDEGIELNAPLLIAGLEDQTVLGFCASMLSDAALWPHLLAQRARDDIPDPQEVLLNQAASRLYRTIVSRAVDQAAAPSASHSVAGPLGGLRTQVLGMQGEFQCLQKLCSPNDNELIERLLAQSRGQIKLDPEFVLLMSINDIHRAAAYGSQFTHQLGAILQLAQANPSVHAQELKCLEHINDARLWSLADESTLANPGGLLMGELAPYIRDETLTRALHACARTTATPHVIKGLLQAGANPSAQSSESDGKSVFWHLLKDRHGVQAAMQMLKEHDQHVDVNESHDRRSLLGRCGELRDDDLVRALADKGARYLEPDDSEDLINDPSRAQERQYALVTASEWGMPEQAKVALAQGADVNGVLKLGITQRTPLISAALHDQDKLVPILLQAGADLDLKISTMRMVPGQPWATVQTDFLGEAIRADSAKVIHVAAPEIGLQRLLEIELPPGAKRVSELLNATRAMGALPDMRHLEMPGSSSLP